MKFHKLKLPKWYIAIALVWTLVVSFMVSVSAETSGSGQTATQGFAWSWETDNKGENAGGSFNGKVESTPTEEYPDLMTLTLEIGATTSTYVPGTEGGCGGVGATDPVNAASTQTTATVTNNTESTFLIHSISIEGTDLTCDLDPNTQLMKGKSFYVYITATPSNTSIADAEPNSGTVKITYTVVQNVTVVYYGADGASYIYKDTTMNGPSDSVPEIVTVGTTLTLPAKPTISAGTFKGWRIGHTGECLAAGDTFTADKDTSIYPVIVADGMVAPFTVNGTAYEFWTDAVVATGGNGTIVLNQDYTLPTTMEANGASPVGSTFVKGTDGNINYIVPEGVTLLIPYNSDNTLCTTEPTFDGDEGTILNASAKTWVTPTAFRTLKMVQGANIAVEKGGAISVSGKVCGYQVSNGCPTGPLGFIEMEADSSITINNGAFLYAWGYITGSGSVTIKSGGTVYENFQLKDWRGGNAAKKMVGTDERVFPSSQYYVQNVEVPMHFEAGALEFGYMCLVASRTFGETTVPFIGGSGMFQNKGTITKDYLEDTDRLMVEVEGDLTMSNLNLAISGIAMNSSDYVLPITNNLSVIVKSGTTTIGQDMCMLPGSVITVAEGATVALAEGVNFFLYDADEWVGKSYVYSSRDVSPLAYVGANKGAPVARAALDDAKIIVNGTVDASLGYAYTTASGGNVTSTGSGTVIIGKIGSKTTTHQATQTGTDIYFDPISINTAWLKNANGTYVHSQADTYTYSLEQGRWLCSSEKHTDTDGNFVCDRCGTFLEGYDLDMLFSFYATNVNLGNNLDMLFAMDPAKLSGGLGTADAPTYYAVFTRADHEAVIVPSNEWETLKIGGTDYYVVAYNGFAAKEMCDTVYVHIYRSSDDLRISECKNGGIRDYAISMLKKVEETELKEDIEQFYLKRVIVDMLYYGAACQEHFNYKENGLATDELTDAQKKYATQTAPSVSDFTRKDASFWAGANLVAESNIQFAVAFKDLSAGAKVEYSFTGHKGNSVSGEVKLENLTESNGVYYFVIPELVVADARCEITIKVTSGNTTQTWTESVAAYVARNATNDESGVFMAFMKFADSANYYLHHKYNQEG